MSRRLPVYLLLDTSESMIGPGIEGLQSAVQGMLRALRSNPQALETVWLSVITFDSEARQVFPLTPIDEVCMPEIQVRPGTAMGAAVRLLAGAIRTEVIRTTPSRKGDWRPLVFLITDGQSTDDWGPALAELDARGTARPANIYAIGCGDDVDYRELGRLTDIVLRSDRADGATFSRLFVWLSASVQTSLTLQGDPSPLDAGGGDASSLPPLPPDLNRVDLSKVPRPSRQPRQVFIRLRCSRKEGASLLRYRYDEEAEVYRVVASHPLPNTGDSASGNGFRLPNVSSDRLIGLLPCPSCGNPVASHCGICGTVFCDGPRESEEGVTCPGCLTQLDAQSGGSFQVTQSAG
jgi:uncharacterized protein YegL